MNNKESLGNLINQLIFDVCLNERQKEILRKALCSSSYQIGNKLISIVFINDINKPNMLNALSLIYKNGKKILEKNDLNLYEKGALVNLMIDLSRVNIEHFLNDGNIKKDDKLNFIKNFKEVLEKIFNSEDKKYIIFNDSIDYNLFYKPLISEMFINILKNKSEEKKLEEESKNYLNNLIEILSGMLEHDVERTMKNIAIFQDEINIVNNSGGRVLLINNAIKNIEEYAQMNNNLLDNTDLFKGLAEIESINNVFDDISDVVIIKSDMENNKSKYLIRINMDSLKISIRKNDIFKANLDMLIFSVLSSWKEFAESSSLFDSYEIKKDGIKDIYYEANISLNTSSNYKELLKYMVEKVISDLVFVNENNELLTNNVYTVSWLNKKGSKYSEKLVQCFKEKEREIILNTQLQEKPLNEIKKNKNKI